LHDWFLIAGRLPKLLVEASNAAIVVTLIPLFKMSVNAGPPATLCVKSVILGNPPGPRLGLNAVDKLTPVIELSELLNSDVKLFKLGAAVLLGIKYVLQSHPAKFWPIIQFRIDALKGLLNQ
jgi:hypothetical protein